MGKKLTTEEFIERSKEVHGEKYDYSKVIYINNYTKVDIICKEHGIFPKIPFDHLKGSRCPYCSGNAPYNYNSLLKKVNDKHSGAICLLESQEIKGVFKKYKFKHLICGYEWLAKANDVLSGQGCPSCAGLIPYTFDTLSEAVIEKHEGKIKLIEGQEIKGNKNKYKFKHICGHEWSATANNVLRGSGCPVCSVHGFKTDKSAIFYIFKINGNLEFTGFGISNKYKQRKSQHDRILKFNNCAILSEILIESDGLTIQNLEQYVKQILNCSNSTIDGFKKESILISSEELLDFCIKWLTERKYDYKIRRSCEKIITL